MNNLTHFQKKPKKPKKHHMIQIRMFVQLKLINVQRKTLLRSHAIYATEISKQTPTLFPEKFITSLPLLCLALHLHGLIMRY